MGTLPSVALPPLARPVAGLPARPSVPSDPAKMWKAARDFEAMALGEFLKPMFDAPTARKNLFSGGEGEKTWKPMLVDEIGKQMAATGGLGLAGPIHDAMLRMQEGKR